MTFSLRILLPFFMFLTACNEPPNETNTLGKLDQKSAPSDHFYFQRGFPDAYPDFDQMERTRKKAIRDFDLNRSKSNGLWTQEGPFNIGGRINCIARHPINTETILVGTAGGGVYRTVDFGENWEPITDQISHLPIGDIVYHPTDANTIFVATGDPNIGGTVRIGNGIYKSTDGGINWENIGLEAARIVSKIVINPANPDEIFAATMGLPFERNNDRGLYRSSNGGSSWEQVLFINDETGVIDLIMDPADPSRLYAATWNRIRTNLESIASGPDAAVYRSVNGGDTWVKLENDLPSGTLSRIGLSLVGDPAILDALFVGEDFQLLGIYRSEDGGDSFDEIPIDGIPSEILGGFGWYFGKIGVNPWNPDHISVLAIDMWSTIDGGANWFMSTPPWFEYTVHADKHDMDYISASEILLATDGGLYLSTDGMNNWLDIENIPNTQFYRVAVDAFDPAFYIGGAQDNGTTGGNADESEWPRLFGGDGFTPIPHPTESDWYYFTTQNGNFWFVDYNTFDLFGMDEESGIVPEDRTNWDAPIIMDPDNPSILYTATERVYKMEDAPFGFWDDISPSLVGTATEFASRRNVSALAQSPLNTNLLYAGTSDGLAWRRESPLNDWEEISTGLPGYYVTDIAPSPYAASHVLLSVSGYRDNDFTPHLYRSQNFGLSWQPVTGDLVEQPINSVLWYSETQWIIGTENGVYFTENAGVNWERAGTNMPFVVVTDLAISPNGQLIAATFAQGIFSIPLASIFDDVVSARDRSKPLLSIYPNPASNALRVSGNSAELSNWRITSLSGTVAKSGQLESNGSQIIDISGLTQGIYLMELFGGSESQLSKFVVSR